MAKKTPAWQIMGLDAPPPTMLSYHDYGLVYTAAEGSQRESLRHVIRIGLWSWHYWGKKVQRAIEFERALAPGTLGQRTMDRVALALVWLTDSLYRRLTPHLEG